MICRLIDKETQTEDFFRRRLTDFQRIFSRIFAPQVIRRIRLTNETKSRLKFTDAAEIRPGARCRNKGSDTAAYCCAAHYRRFATMQTATFARFARSCKDSPSNVPTYCLRATVDWRTRRRLWFGACARKFPIRAT